MKLLAIVSSALLLAVCAADLAGAAQAPVPPLPGLTPEDRAREAAEAAAIRYVGAAPTVESDTVVSQRVRTITVNDHGRLCVVEVTYDGVIDPKTAKDRLWPYGWLVSHASCAPGEVAFVAH